MNNMNVKGFTLIELLIVVAIVGIMAKLSYPSYVENMQKSKRAEAGAALISLASALETWKMQHNGQYNGDAPTLANLGFTGNVPVMGGATATYTLSMPVLTASTYTLNATPVKTDRCAILTYDHLGNKGSTSGNTDCWS